MNRAISDFHYSNPELSAVEGKQALLHTLLYFDIFHYPLRLPEILQFSNLVTDHETGQQWLQELIDAGTVFQIGEFYLLHNDPGLPALCPRAMLIKMQILISSSLLPRIVYGLPVLSCIYSRS